MNLTLPAFLLLLVFSRGLAADVPAVETIAGTGEAALGLREGKALEVAIGQPFGVEVGPDGAVYICEVENHRVLRLDREQGTITTVAGDGVRGSRGDGGPSIEARLDEPYEVRIDGSGNLYVVEMRGARVRRIEKETGTITTVAGTGIPGFSGDGGPAARAELRQPHSIALDEKGSLYIADIGNHRVRRVDLETGTIETIAGNGERALPPAGEVATGRPLLGPRALAADGGTLWIALREGHSIWKMDLATRRIAPVAGTGTPGYRDGPAGEARFNGPKGIAVGPDGDIYVADTENQCIRKVERSGGAVRTVAGSGPEARGFGGDGGPATACRMDRPHGIAVDPHGVLYIGDTNNHRVRAVRYPGDGAPGEEEAHRRASVPAPLPLPGSTPDEARALAELYLAGRIDHGHLLRVVEVLERQRDPRGGDGLDRLLSQVLEAGLLSSVDPATVRRIEALVSERGDARRGRAVYLDSQRAQCASCHRLETVGSHVGPDLTRVWETYPLSDLVEAILEPSRRIREGFETYVVTTRKGQVYSGLRMEHDEARTVIRDALGNDTEIPAGEIAGMRTSETSLMPERLTGSLNLQEFLDLLAFLKDRAAQESLRNDLAQAWVVGPYSRVLGKSDAPETSPDPLKIVAGGDGRILQWQRLDASAGGHLDLATVFPEKQVSAYVLAWIESEAAQEVELLLEYEERLRLFAGGRMVFTSAPGTRSGKVKVRLAAGRNTLLARVVRGNGPFTLRLRILGGGGIRFSTEAGRE